MSAGGPVVAGSRVFVRGIRIEAEIGIHGHEHGHTQPLVVDVELDMAFAGAVRLSETLDYVTILAAARRVAAEGHIKLVETYAERLAHACLADPRVTRVRVRVEKPEALAPAALAAGVEITLAR